MLPRLLLSFDAGINSLKCGTVVAAEFGDMLAVVVNRRVVNRRGASGQVAAALYAMLLSIC